MFYKHLFTLFLVYINFSVHKCNADRIKDSMYINIQGSVACYRRMNSTHQIGCSSERGGSLGVVHYCDTLADLDFILENGSAGKYIPVLPTKLLNLELMNKLVNNKEMISGLIVHPNNDTLSYFSHEDKCPNQLFSAESASCPAQGWNPWGTSLLYADIPFPMFYIEQDTQISTIRDCFQRFNNFSYSTQDSRSLCSLELNAFMYGTSNTPTCQRRSNIVTNLNPVKLCDPLGDSNVWGALFPLVTGPENNTKPVKDFKYVVVAARMDTTSLFEKTSGAESPVTGIVTLLMVAKLLKEMLPSWKEEYQKVNVLFMFLNGETYDYIGSQRLLYDMEQGQFPTDLPLDNDILPTIHPENITLFVELSQFSVGKATYAHYLKDDLVVTNFIQHLNQSNPSTIPLSVTPNSLPPSSLHTFNRGNSSMKGLILTDHEVEYQNRFYNSLYDNASNIRYEYHNGSAIGDATIQKYVGDVALMVAKSIFMEITGESYKENVSADLTLVDELFHCYLEDPNCKIHRAVQKGHLPKNPLSLYVGVSVVANFLPTLVALTLAWFTGDPVGPSDINCTNVDKSHVYRFYNMSASLDRLSDTLCFRATVNVTDAVSPAFIIEDYDWASNKYSSWSESTWNDMNMRMFLRPSRAHERLTLALGSATMIFFFVAVYWVRSRCHILFDYPLVDDPPVNC